MHAYFRGYTDFGGTSPKEIEIAGNCPVTEYMFEEIPYFLDVVGIKHGYVEIAGLIRIERDKDGNVTLLDLKS